MTYPQPAHQLVAVGYQLRIGTTRYDIDLEQVDVDADGNPIERWDGWADTPQDAANALIEQWTTDHAPTMNWQPHTVRHYQPDTNTWEIDNRGWRSADLRWVIRPIQNDTGWQLLDMYPPDSILPHTEGTYATANQAKAHAQGDLIDRWIESLK